MGKTNQTILTKMKVVDKTLKVKSIVNEAVQWNTLENLPEDEEFTEHLQL